MPPFEFSAEPEAPQDFILDASNLNFSHVPAEELFGEGLTWIRYREYIKWKVKERAFYDFLCFDKFVNKVLCLKPCENVQAS